MALILTNVINVTRVWTTFKRFQPTPWVMLMPAVYY